MTPPGIPPFVLWGARLVVMAGVCVLVLMAYRSVRRHLPSAAALVAVGILVRASLGAALFFVSYFDLPILRGLHTGDGFWHLAPDARLYYGVAEEAAVQGLEVIDYDDPSPAFIRVLTVWMHLVGFSPASAALLNLCCFLAIVWVIARALPRHPSAALVAIAGFSLSPALLVFGTQSLKDVLFSLLLVVTCAGAWLLLGHAPSARIRSRELAVALGVSIALYLVAGIRTYTSLFVGLTLGAALLFAAARPWMRPIGPRLARAAALLLVINVLWLAGPAMQSGFLRHYLLGRQAGADAGALIGQLENSLDQARSGFIASGGATNLGGHIRAEGLAGKAAAMGYGLLLIVVPLSLLALFGLATLGGRGAFLVIADLDTVFIDLSLVALAVVMYRAARSGRLNLPYALFVLALAALTTIALAYVVTNFGTLFRLRLMAVVPLWMLALAVRTPGGTAE